MTDLTVRWRGGGMGGPSNGGVIVKWGGGVDTPLRAILIILIRSGTDKL